MRNNNWPKIKDLLNDALELPLSERTAFLDSISDTDLRREVATLLSFEENAEEMLGLSAVEFSKDFVDVNEAPMAGKQIGIYRVIRELGRGGMGAVYLAERNDKKFEQRVALKLLKSEMNSAEIRRHFEQEREILASLNHPNIALLLDAGTTDDNTPFIAMEYIDGLPIDKYCDENGYGVRRRTELFRTVCSAVDHAHRNLVVHRDLKPSNVLVNKDGIPKLLDFGISKILSAGMGDADFATITQMGAMTPSYASPEQLSKKSVSTATDVYSLGVMLYELLSGHRPFESEEHDLRKVYEAVVNAEPVPPSQVAAGSMREIEFSKPPHLIIEDEPTDDPNATIGRDRSDTRPQTVGVAANEIRGDLDNIVLKAIRKEPERRYLSAQSLSEDLGRFLNGLPVEARPNTFSYRAEKFIKRNKLSVISICLVSLAILTGSVATFWQAQVAERERTRAEKRFSDVRKLANTYLFDVYPEVENLEGSLKAREKIVSTALEYLDSLAGESGDDPELQAELAKAYEKIGDVQGATNTPTNADMEAGLESYRKARELRENILRQKPNDPEAKNDLAQNYYVTARTLWWANDTPGAEEFFEKALTLRRGLYAEHPEEAKFQDRLAVTLMDYGAIPAYNSQIDKAKPLFEEAKGLITDLIGKQPDNSQFKKTYARFLRSYSEVKKTDGDYDGAISDLNEATRITEKLITETPNNYILNRSMWINEMRTCEVYIKKGDGPSAVPICVKAIDFNKESLAKEPDDAAAATDLAISYFNAARGYRLDEQHEKAIENATLALGVITDLLKRSPDTNDYIRAAAIYRNEIAENELALKRPDAALAQLTQARGPLEKVVARDAETTTYRYDLGNTYRLMARAYFAKSDKARAGEMIGKAIECIQYLKDKNALSKADESLLNDLIAEKARYGS
jgi:non-specific serine/threonine protein kinase/serine/threonine-protein kinase